MGNKKSFWTFIVPAMLLRVGLACYVAGFIFNSFPPTAESSLVDFLFKLGVPALFWGAILALPLGILAHWFTKKAKAGKSNEQTAFTESNSWVAFFWPFLWALFSKQNRRLIPALIPGYNLYLSAHLATHGRAESWNGGGWRNFEQFKKRQTFLPWLLPLLFVVAFFGVLIVIGVYVVVTTTVATAVGFGEMLTKIGVIVASGWRH